jgi:RNA polymerase sigma factor (sigma-70 family)
MSRKPWWVTMTPEELSTLRRRALRTIEARFRATLGVETEDVLHHAFVALFRNRDSVSPEDDGLYRYLVVAARRAALDRIKTAALRADRREHAAKPAHHDHTPLVETLLREKKAEVREIFDELDEVDRLLLRRHVIEGQSLNAVARELGIGWHRADAAVKRILTRIRRMLLD